MHLILFIYFYILFVFIYLIKQGEVHIEDRQIERGRDRHEDRHLDGQAGQQGAVRHRAVADPPPPVVGEDHHAEQQGVEPEVAHAGVKENI